MTETVPERMARRQQEREERIAKRNEARADREAQSQRLLDQALAPKVVTDLSAATEEDLLAELLRRRPPQPGPRTVAFSGGIMVATIGIGKDHTASVYIFDTDMAVLNDLAR